MRGRWLGAIGAIAVALTACQNPSALPEAPVVDDMATANAPPQTGVALRSLQDPVVMGSYPTPSPRPGATAAPTPAATALPRP